MWHRNISERLRESLADTPCVVVHGPRQAGKTTLVRDVLPTMGWSGRYVTLDDASALAAAASDPEGFLSAPGSVVIDEIQRAPGLLPALKAAIDRDRAPGRFVLTGSADLLALPRLSAELAGRAEVLTLWPLAQAEIAGRSPGLLPGLLAGLPPKASSCTIEDVLDRARAGGFPEPVARLPARRAAWFDSYVTMVLQRDVRELSQVQSLAEMPRLLSLLAARTGGLLNKADLARDASQAASTLERHLALLQATFLVRLLPAWFANVGKRLVKAPKVVMSDTGLAASLLGGAVESAGAALSGPLVETFVATEVMKHASWMSPAPQVLHYRTHGREEVDLVVETPSALVGIEVKCSRSVRAEDFRGLRSLQEAAGSRFACGVVLHPGAAVVPFGPKLWSAPISSLW